MSAQAATASNTYPPASVFTPEQLAWIGSKVAEKGRSAPENGSGRRRGMRLRVWCSGSVTRHVDRGAALWRRALQ